MTFDFSLEAKCPSCSFGKCTAYIREQSKRMKDRDTLYRISQNKLMACVFDQGIPGMPGYTELLDETIDSILFRMLGLAEASGRLIERIQPEHFGETEAEFVITSSQAGKIRGDIAEMLMRAIFWNMCAGINAKLYSETSGVGLRCSPALSILTVGDNYGIHQLFMPEYSNKIHKFVSDLAEYETGLYYSTPDFFIINVAGLDEESRFTLSQPIPDLGLNSQQRLVEARRLVEGKLRPEDVVMVFGLKTSIRSDRMYQFLYEANGFKAVWRGAFDLKPPLYLSVMTRIFGANYKKLESVEFLSLLDESPAKAIDKVVHGETVREITESLSAQLIKLLLGA